jgi:hypothetical protein
VDLLEPPETTWLPGELSAIRGSTLPRIWTKPLVTGAPGPCGCGCALTPETSYGFEAADFADRVCGRPFDDWQRWAAIHAGELLPDGRPRFRFVLLLVARQNGKTELLVLLTTYWLFAVGDLVDDFLVLGTSTKLDYAKESWRKVVKIVRRTNLAEYVPQTGIRKANGEVEIVTVDEARYKIAASNEEGGRSLTIHRLVMDELRQHDSYLAHDAAVPATDAVPDAQIWGLSNMGGDKSVVLNDYRESAHAFIRTGVGDERLGIFEWSAEHGPGNLPDPTDVAELARANPNLNHPSGRNPLDAIIGRAIRAKEAGGKALTGFLTESMCVRVPTIDPAVDPVAWAGCCDPSAIPIELRRRVAFCLDVSMDGLHATLAAAVVLPDGRVRVEVVAQWSGPDCTGQLRRDLTDRPGRPAGLLSTARPRVLGWLPGGPAAAVGADLKTPKGQRRPVRLPAGIRVEEIRTEVPMVCMSFSALVSSSGIAHSDDGLINAHVSGAERLWSGEVWRFIRKGAGHVDAAYAVAGAAHLALTMPQPVNPGSRAQRERERLSVKLDTCVNPLCDRLAPVGQQYCCPPCNLAHDGRFEIHETGPLGHSVGCNQAATMGPDF